MSYYILIKIKNKKIKKKMELRETWNYHGKQKIRIKCQNKWNWQGLLLVYPFEILSNRILFVYPKMATAQNHLNVIN
jgi:hypothetical protein